MSIIYWRCVSCSVISFLLIFLDTRTGRFSSWTFKGCLGTGEGEFKRYFFDPRCNAGRLLYGVPDSARRSGVLGLSSCHTGTWHKGTSPKPFTRRTAEKKHPLPQRSQTLCTGNRRAGCGPSSELLPPQRWGWMLMEVLMVLYITVSASGWWRGRLGSEIILGGFDVKMGTRSSEDVLLLCVQAAAFRLK